jgi:NTP pyrophosphatase (non-canonical NTP hydrolase)
MMREKWAPKHPAERKARLIEEIGEVLQEQGKADRFGLDTRYDHNVHAVTHADDTKWESNRESLIRELEDLLGAIKSYLIDLRLP